MESDITREKPVPDAYNDKTELSDNQIDAFTREVPMWIDGIVLENVPKCFETSASSPVAPYSCAPWLSNCVRWGGNCLKISKI